MKKKIKIAFGGLDLPRNYTLNNKINYSFARIVEGEAGIKLMYEAKKNYLV